MTDTLEVQRCEQCQKWNVPSLSRCPVDPDHVLSHQRLSEFGHVFSFTTTHIAMSEAARDHVPYSTALIEFDDGLRLLTHVDSSLEPLHIGMRVRVSAVQDSDDAHRPHGSLLAAALEDEVGQEPLRNRK